MRTINNIIPSIVTLCLLFITTTAFAQSIDDNSIKKNVAVIDQPLSKLAQLQPQTFEYNKDSFKGLKLPNGKQYGFVTENVETVFPGMVQYQNYSYAVGKNSFRTARVKNVDTERLVPVLVAAVQELQAEVERLKAEVQELKSPK